MLGLTSLVGGPITEMLTCPGCGKKITYNAYHCKSYEESCKNKECREMRFCSSDCLQRCWRAVNWPKVVYVIEPALDTPSIVSEAIDILETSKLRMMLEPTSEPVSEGDQTSSELS
jgi:hypothetical protein